MGLGLTSGGHLTHGHYTAQRAVSATSLYFESLPYEVDKTTGLIDFDLLRERALAFRPRMIIAGASGASCNASSNGRAIAAVVSTNERSKRRDSTTRVDEISNFIRSSSSSMYACASSTSNLAGEFRTSMIITGTPRRVA